MNLIWLHNESNWNGYWTSLMWTNEMTTTLNNQHLTKKNFICLPHSSVNYTSKQIMPLNDCTQSHSKMENDSTVALGSHSFSQFYSVCWNIDQNSIFLDQMTICPLTVSVLLCRCTEKQVRFVSVRISWGLPMSSTYWSHLSAFTTGSR